MIYMINIKEKEEDEKNAVEFINYSLSDDAKSDDNFSGSRFRKSNVEMDLRN